MCKVLEQVKDSRVFKPPNPWLMAIMKLLAELYHFADLKLNLKFEVEVLCKNIKLDIKDIEPTTLLRNRPSKADQVDQAAKEFEKLNIGPPPTLPTNISPTLLAGQTTPTTQTGGTLPATTSVGFPNLANYITFNPQIPLFNTQPNLKRFVHIAIDRAIREIIAPVVERSVTIATIATRELTIKDFALEPNEEKMRKSAHLMVQALAGSLSSVTCREPLRISMISNLRTLLMQNGFTEQSLPEQAIFMTVADNLDLACSVIEKAAAEKSVPEADDNLAASYANRRKHRERTGQPYYDMAVYAASRYPSTLPEALRLKPGGLSVTQMRVYEDFARTARQGVAENPAVEGTAAVAVATRVQALVRPSQQVVVATQVQPAVLAAPQELPQLTAGYEAPVPPMNAQQIMEKLSVRHPILIISSDGDCNTLFFF